MGITGTHPEVASQRLTPVAPVGPRWWFQGRARVWSEAKRVDIAASCTKLMSGDATAEHSVSTQWYSTGRLSMSIAAI